MSTADDSRYQNDHDDRVGGQTFRNRKGRGPFRAHMYSDQGPGAPGTRTRYRGGQKGGGGQGPRTRFDDEDGDVAMTDSNSQDGSSQHRFNPYGRPNRRGDDRFDRGRRGGGGGGHRGRSNNRGDGGGDGRNTWFKIFVPYGKKYDKDWLITALQSICSIPFTPVNYQVEGNRAQFYIDDSITANALLKISRKITDKEGYKVTVLMNSCPPPSFLQSELKPADLEHLKQCMAKRFDRSQQALDLNNIRIDPDLVSQNIDVTLNRKNSMHAVIKIIEENIPELVCLNISNNKLFRLDDLSELVNKAPNLKTLNLSHNELKTERELDRIKGLKLVELWLERNPLCDYFKDHASYISTVRERFPRLLKLDGQDLPPPIVFDVEVTPAALPPCKASYFCSEEIKTPILAFLQQYYSVYDSGDRQPLLDAYHDGATFSLSMFITMQNPSRYPLVTVSRCSLGDYHKDTRNLKKLKDPSTRFRLLKHTRLNVVAFLNELPKTHHDTASLNVDVNTFTSLTMSLFLSFTLVEGKSRDSVRAFSRVFITVPAGGTSLCIVNDELFVRNATTEEIRRAFVAPAPTPSSSPVPTLSAPQQEMLSAFSLKSAKGPEASAHDSLLTQSALENRLLW
uniref:NTF2 domain-containing protein n=1 Tax=Oncorhynchus tshawytscha TaxID=74940 RepID=A0A8C8HPT8_ONCTS